MRDQSLSGQPLKSHTHVSRRLSSAQDMRTRLCSLNARNLRPGILSGAHSSSCIAPSLAKAGLSSAGLLPKPTTLAAHPSMYQLLYFLPTFHQSFLYGVISQQVWHGHECAT